MHGGIVAGRAKGDGGFAWPVRGKPRPGGAALPRTGQTACHDSSGKAVACPGTGQDGELREGAAWPAPRFSDNGDGTVTDGLTGLAWSRDGGTPGPGVCGPGKRKTWKGALEHVGCLNANRHLGRSDWRLPNRNELSSLVHRGEQDGGAWLSSQGFSGVRDGAYWTSSTYSFSSWSAWGIILRDGAASSFAKKHRIDVWPVRGGR